VPVTTIGIIQKHVLKTNFESHWSVSGRMFMLYFSHYKNRFRYDCARCRKLSQKFYASNGLTLKMLQTRFSARSVII